MRVSSRPVTCAVWIAALATVGWAGSWPRFRGPNGQGIGDLRGLPVTWTTSDYAWSLDLPGTGHSSPVVWGDTVWVTCADPNTPRGTLLAVDTASGRIRWRWDTPLAPAKMNRLNHYATGTPALTSERVYTLWSTGPETLLVAFDHAGRERFRRTFGPTTSRHGPGVSPIVWRNRVVFTHEQEGGRPGLWLAVDAQTGQPAWQLERGQGSISYSTPCVLDSPGAPARLIFTSRTHGITAVDPNSGTVVWEAAEALPARVVSSPVLGDGLVLATCGAGTAGKQLTALRPPRTTEGNPETVWRVTDGKTTPYVSTGVVHEGLVYLFHDRGMVVCREAATGQLVWSHAYGEGFYASPLSIRGRLYAVTRKGVCVVLATGRAYHVLGETDLGEVSDATPALSAAGLLLRTASRLHCLPPQSPVAGDGSNGLGM